MIVGMKFGCKIPGYGKRSDVEDVMEALTQEALDWNFPYITITVRGEQDVTEVIKVTETSTKFLLDQVEQVLGSDIWESLLHVQGNLNTLEMFVAFWDEETVNNARYNRAMEMFND